MLRTGMPKIRATMECASSWTRIETIRSAAAAIPTPQLSAAAHCGCHAGNTPTARLTLTRAKMKTRLQSSSIRTPNARPR